MEEQLAQRRAELEIAAKNAIVEIFVIEEQRDAIDDALKNKRKNVDNINASLRELEYIIRMLKAEQKEEEQNEDDE